MLHITLLVHQKVFEAFFGVVLKVLDKNCFERFLSKSRYKFTLKIYQTC